MYPDARVVGRLEMMLLMVARRCVEIDPQMGFVHFARPSHLIRKFEVHGLHAFGSGGFEGVLHFGHCKFNVAL